MWNMLFDTRPEGMRVESHLAHGRPRGGGAGSITGGRRSDHLHITDPAALRHRADALRSAALGALVAVCRARVKAWLAARSESL